MKRLPIITPYQNPETYSSFHLYVIRLQDNAPNYRITLFNHLRNHGIGVNIHYIPVHTQPYYRQMGFQYGDFPNAEAYYQEVISLPIYPTMTDKQQGEVVKALEFELGVTQ